MEEIKLTPEELKKAIDFGKLIGSGFFSDVFTYKGRLIKMDHILYQLLKVNDPRLSHDVIEKHYFWNKNDFNDREQLEELEKRQPHIRTKVPEGIITIKDNNPSINGISPGIIIPHFKGYSNFRNISKDDYKRLLILFKKVFEDIKELADNEIAQEDLYHYNQSKDSSHKELYDHNILQKGNDAQIIDMSGPLIKVGKDFENADRMYSEFAHMINHYYEENGLEPIYQASETITEDKLAEMITELEKQIRSKK